MGRANFHDGRHPVFTRRKVDHWAEKSRGLLWEGNFMMGGTLFSPERSWFKGVFTRRKVAHWVEKSRGLLWGGPIS